MCQATFLPTTNVADIPGSATAVYPVAEQKNARTEVIIPDRSITVKGVITPGDYIVDAKDADNDSTWTAVGSNPTVDRLFGYALTSTQQAAMTGQNKTPYIAVMAYVKLHYTVQFTQVNQSLRSVSS